MLCALALTIGLSTPGTAAAIESGQSLAPTLPLYVETTCSQCHDISVVTSQRHSPEQWNELVDKMTDLGLMTDDANLARIKFHLAKAFPDAVAA